LKRRHGHPPPGWSSVKMYLTPHERLLKIRPRHQKMLRLFKRRLLQRNRQVENVSCRSVLYVSNSRTSYSTTHPRLPPTKYFEKAQTESNTRTRDKSAPQICMSLRKSGMGITLPSKPGQSGQNWQTFLQMRDPRMQILGVGRGSNSPSSQEMLLRDSCIVVDCA
jgi:hypothetical protein